MEQTALIQRMMSQVFSALEGQRELLQEYLEINVHQDLESIKTELRKHAASLTRLETNLPQIQSVIPTSSFSAEYRIPVTGMDAKLNHLVQLADEVAP